MAAVQRQTYRMTVLLGFLVLGFVLQSCGPRAPSCTQPDRAIKTALLLRSLGFLEQNVRPGAVAPATEWIRIGLHDPSMEPPEPMSLFGKPIVFVDASASPAGEFRSSEDLLIDFTYWEEHCLATIHFSESPTAVLEARPPGDWRLASLSFTYKDGAWVLAGPTRHIIDYPPPDDRGAIQ